MGCMTYFVKELERHFVQKRSLKIKVFLSLTVPDRETYRMTQIKIRFFKPFWPLWKAILYNVEDMI